MRTEHGGTIGIAGAGIGGLTAALTLHERGFEVRVFESVRALRPLGVGINLGPHGAKVLYELGLKQQLDEIGIPTRAIEYRTRYGQLIQSDPRNVEAGFSASQYSIHRGELQLLLYRTVCERLGADAVEVARAVAGFEQTADRVTVRFANGGSFECDGLVGADGLHSAVRHQIHPDEGPIHYAGTMMHRGAVMTDVLGDGRTMIIAGNHRHKFVTYPISEQARRQGRALTNWVAEVRTDQPRHVRDADWLRASSRDFINLFEEFDLPGLNPARIMRATEQITEFPMVDRDPVSFWTVGRVTLLGDAAHPMYPMGANGASQAIVDGRALAECLAKRPIPAGLKDYEAKRLPVTNAVVLANRQTGPERVLDIADARVTGPDDRIEDLISAAELEAVAADYRRVAGFTKPSDT